MNTLELSQFNQDKENPVDAELLFGGDFCPIRRYEEKIMTGKDIFDDGLKTLFQNSFSMINLEAPLCEKDLPAASPGGYGLRGKPEVADYLRNLGIDAAGLGNNHIRDFRDAGVIQTMENLEKSGILFAGAGRNLFEAEKPMTLKINDLNIGIWVLAEKELNLAGDNSPGSSWFNPERNLPMLTKMREDYDFLIIFLHAGHEFISTPSPRIRNACRAFVDAGADAIIAHHPHVIEGAERYKDALIAYSLSNLVFDSSYVSAYQNTDSGYLVRLNISKHHINDVEIIPYKLRKNIIVTSLDKAEFDDFSKNFKELSENITNDQKFYQEWENNVRFRWETDYRNILNDFSKNMNDPENKDYARRSRNLFACPTHAEMIEKIFLMLEEGKLSRSE